MKKGLIVLFVVVVLMAATSMVQAGTYVDINVNGNTADWVGIDPIDTDADDVDNNDVDWMAGYLANNDTNLFIREDVVGEISASESNIYIIYIDIDQKPETGFNGGWWTTMGAEYRIYTDAWNKGIIQSWAGTEGQGHDNWNNTQPVSVAWVGSSIEYGINMSLLGNDTDFNVLWRTIPGDDAMNYYTGGIIGYSVATSPAKKSSQNNP